MTGAQAAERILYSAGIYDVRIEHVRGDLTDHYDPRNRVLRLSDTVYGSTSVAAIGVAAHECGHAVQDQKDYAPLRIRNSLVPVANFGTMAAWPIIILGLIFGASSFLINLGILLFSLGVLFPAGDAAGGVRRVPQSHRDAGEPGDSLWRRGKADQKGLKRGGHDLRGGGSGGDPVPAPSADSLRRKRQ